MNEPTRIFSCTDECGAQETVPITTPCPPGWRAMEFRKGYRCPACVKALDEVNSTKEKE